MKTIIGACLIVGGFAVSGLAGATLNFQAPDWCDKGVTGAPSSDLATEGDPPVVNIEYYPRGASSEPVDYDQLVYDDKNNQWYVSFLAPSTSNYTISTTYTPFLITSQSQSLYKGGSGYILLANPRGTTYRERFSSFTVALGSGLGDAFIEFEPNYAGSDPFTMQVDSAGNLTIYCYIYSEFTANITVYDKNNEFYKTGFMNKDGSVSWY